MRSLALGDGTERKKTCTDEGLRKQPAGSGWAANCPAMRQADAVSLVESCRSIAGAWGPAALRKWTAG